mmetsp:Transcript_29249/g.73595  ORF Transcript_29249/g.73595 Transcript_29249/m.73595 type:complete len:139 (-) Transcript_29249:196-612(-)
MSMSTPASAPASSPCSSSPPSTTEGETDLVASTCTSSSKSKVRVELKSWSGVAVWQWSGIQEECAICKCSLTSVCIECEANQAIAVQDTDSTECSISWGECQHAFHHHCITRWLETALQTCPLDQAPWRFARMERQHS